MSKPSTQTPASLGVINIGLVVQNYEKSHEFYTSIIGMTKITAPPYMNPLQISKKDSEGAGFAGNQPFKIYFYEMVNATSATNLKMICFDTPPGEHMPTGIEKQSGVNYLTFNLDGQGYAAVVRRINKMDYPKLGSLSTDNFQATYIQDPNGVFLELLGPPAPHPPAS